jgi:hypothetical protein
MFAGRGSAESKLANPMTETDLTVEVSDDEIIVTQRGRDFLAIYHIPEDEPRLVAKAMPIGTHEFKARAWRAANDKARRVDRKLGRIV